MGGDYSRVRFDPAKAFAGVLKQQGRVSLDAEFNEYVELTDRHWRAETLEVVGPCGVPHAVPRELPPGTPPEPFLIRLVGPAATDLTIGRGRAYVDGILVECRGSTTAGLAGATSAAFEITATPPAPPQATSLGFLQQPSTTQAGQVITPAVQVAALDASGNLATGFTGSITIALGANPGAGTLLGTRTVNAVHGVATFGDLRIDNTGIGYTLQADALQATRLTGATSAAFDITATPPPPRLTTHLGFTRQPTTTQAGHVITPAVQVAALDASGNVASSFTGPIMIELGANPGGGMLSGTATVNAVHGVATFDNLSIDQAGIGYKLHATAAFEYDMRLGEERGAGPLAYSAQPFYYGTDFPALSADTEVVDTVYLDVWEREVTAVEDPSLQEEALGGPDTAGRMQVAWQVKVLQPGDFELRGCAYDTNAWKAVVQPSTALLTSRAAPGAPAPGPCVIAPGGGYSGLDNRLYRVEIHSVDIHAGDALGTAHFKWSRDNATLVASVTQPIQAIGTNHSIIVVSSTGRDQALRFEQNDHLELLDDYVEFGVRDRGFAGSTAQIVNVDHVNGKIEVDTDLSSFTVDATRHPRVRRWDVKDASQDWLRAAQPGVALELEKGISITFGPDANATVHAGDYWVFAARTASGRIEELQDAPPRGILHHYCKLALVNRVSSPPTRDCRRAFPPLTDIHAEDVKVRDTCLLHVTTLQDVFNKQCAERVLRYVGGDGQEQLPGTPLDAELVVAVEDGFGRPPPTGATVVFSVTQGSPWSAGTLQPHGGGPPGMVLPVPTGTDGTARCRWTIGSAPGENEVTALLASAPTTPQPQVVFHARGLTAADVAVTDTICGLGVPNLQAVFDKQCEERVLRYVSGDGQEGATGVPLTGELIVGVEDGFGRPQGGVSVTFGVQTGNGTANPASVASGADGLARCRWTLGSVAGSNILQADIPGGHLPVVFHAMGVTPEAAGVWPTIVQARDAFHPENDKPNWTNDQSLALSVFNSGLQVLFSEEMDGTTLSTSTFFVTLEVPFTDQGYQGRHSFIVPGRVQRSADTRAIWVFTPDPPLLAATLDVWMREGAGIQPPGVRGRVVLKGNTILSAQAHQPLDGEAFGEVRSAAGNAYTDLHFPSGDGRRGGDFESWFWLVPGVTGLSLDPPNPTVGQTVTGTVSLSGLAPAGTAVIVTQGPLYTGPAPDPVPVPALAQAVTFHVVPQGQAAGKVVTIKASLGGSSASNSITVAGGGGVVIGPGTPLITPFVLGPLTAAVFDPANFPGRLVTEVSGIDPAAAKSLELAGVVNLAQLASLDPARLSQVLGVSEVRAMSIIDEARRRLMP